MGWGLALALAAGPQPVVDLVWEAPIACPRHAEVLAAIERRAPAPTAAAPVAAHAVVEEADGHYVVQVRVSAPGTAVDRRIDAQSCQEAADAAALLIAVMVDPSAALAATPDPLSPIAPPPPRDSARPPTLVTGFLRLSGAGSFGTLPRWGGGPALAGGIDSARVRVEARTFLDAPQTTIIEGTSARATFLSWNGAVLGCFVPGRGTVTVPLCLGPELQWVRARAEGFASGRTVHRWVVDVLGGVALSYSPVRWLAMRLEVDGFIVLTPGRFVIDDLGPLHRIRAGGVRLGLGIELRLPSLSAKRGRA